MGARTSVHCLALITIAWVGFLSSLASTAPVLTIDVTPRIAFAPAGAKVIVMIPPDEANAHLAVAIAAQGSDFVVDSSQKTLAGENERREHCYFYRQIPEGHYVVVAAVFDQQGKERGRADRTFERRGRGEHELWENGPPWAEAAIGVLPLPTPEAVGTIGENPCLKTEASPIAADRQKPPG